MGLNVLGNIRKVLYSVTHFLGGVITGVVSRVNPILAVLMFITFIIYELDEDWHLNDDAYKDILEYMVGLYGSALVDLYLMGGGLT
jgi:hypothetical protein